MWALLACPTVGCTIAAVGTHGKGSLVTFVFLFLGLPAFMAAVAVRPLGVRRIDGGRGVVGAALVGALGWFVIVAWIASGIHD